MFTPVLTEYSNDPVGGGTLSFGARTDLKMMLGKAAQNPPTNAGLVDALLALGRSSDAISPDGDIAAADARSLLLDLQAAEAACNDAGAPFDRFGSPSMTPY